MVNLKNSKGITLIALVVTIIVILILACIVIKTAIDQNILDKMDSGTSQFEISEDIDIISEIKKEILIKNEGEVILSELKDTLSKRNFPAYEGIEKYGDITIANDQLLVGCPHGKHVYIVSGDETKKFDASVKDVPVITIEQLEPVEDEHGEKNVTLKVTITCENGLKSICLPNGTTSGISETDIKNADTNVKNVIIEENLTKVEIEYNVTKSGEYTLKGTSKQDVTTKKTERVYTIVPGGEEIITISYEPTEDTNDKVKATITTTNTDKKYYLEYKVCYTNGDLIQDWQKGTEYTTNRNCIVYARLRDGKGNLGSQTYKEILNIDRLSPSLSSISVSNRTNTSFTIDVTAKDADATIEHKMSGIASVKLYVNDEFYKEYPASKKQEETVSCLVTDRSPGTTYSYYVIGVDNAGNETAKSEIKDVKTLEEYTVTIRCGSYITSVSGAGKYTVGDSVRISATVLSSNSEYNYSWSRWTGDTSVLGSASTQTQTFTMPAHDVTLTANGTASARSYILTVTASPTEGGTVSGGGSKTYGTLCTVNARASSSYLFEGWYEGSTLVSSNASYSFSMPARNRSLVARFKLNKVTVTVIAGDYISSVTLDGESSSSVSKEYTPGTSVTISATPRSASTEYNYSWSRWTGDTSVLSNASTQTQTFIMPENDVVLTATGTRTTRSYVVTYYNGYSEYTKTVKPRDTFSEIATPKGEYNFTVGATGSVSGGSAGTTSNSLRAVYYTAEYEFIGWSKNDIWQGETTEKPADCSKEYEITGNITLYAVYSFTGIEQYYEVPSSTTYTMPFDGVCAKHEASTFSTGSGSGGNPPSYSRTEFTECSKVSKGTQITTGPSEEHYVGQAPGNQYGR